MTYIDISKYYKPTIFSRLGDFWTKHFPEAAFTEAVVRALEDEANQVFIRIHEDLALLTDIEKAPLYHTELWHAFIIFESEMTQEDPRAVFYGSRPVTYGSDQSWTYGKGFPDKPVLFCWPKPEQLIHPGCVMNSPTQATYAGFMNQDYWCSSRVIGFTINPFHDSRFTPFTTEHGRALILWLRMSRWDMKDFANVYATPLGLPHLPSSEQYRDVCVGVWKSRTQGQSESALYRVISGLTGIPLCRNNNETVRAIFTTSRHKIVVTDKYVYRFPSSHTVAVTVGQILREGQALTHQMYVKRLMDIKSGEEPVTLPPEFFNVEMKIVRPIRFPNIRVPVQFIPVPQQDTYKTIFRLDGNIEEVKKYQTELTKRKVYQIFDKRNTKTTFPSINDLVSQVNPALLIRQFARANLLIVFGDKGTWKPHVDLMQFANKIFNFVVPPHGAVIFSPDLSSSLSVSYSSESLSSISYWSPSFSSWSSKSTESSSLSTLSTASSRSTETSSSSWWSVSESSRSSESTSSTSETDVSAVTESSRSSQSKSSQSKSSVSQQSYSSQSSRSSQSTFSSFTSPSSLSSMSSRSSKSTESSSTQKKFSTSSLSSRSSQSYSSRSTQSESSQSLSSLSSVSESSQSLSSLSSVSESSNSSSSYSFSSQSDLSSNSSSSKSSLSTKSSSSSASAGYFNSNNICGKPIPFIGNVLDYRNYSLSDLLNPSHPSHDRFMNRAIYIEDDARLWYIRKINTTYPIKLLGLYLHYTIYPYLPISIVRTLCNNSYLQHEFPEYLVVFHPKTTEPEEVICSSKFKLSPQKLLYVQKLESSIFSINTVSNGVPKSTLIHNALILSSLITPQIFPDIRNINDLYVAFVSKFKNTELDYVDYTTVYTKPMCHLSQRLNHYIFTQYNVVGPHSTYVSNTESTVSFSSQSSSSADHVQFVPETPRYRGAYFGATSSGVIVSARKSESYIMRRAQNNSPHPSNHKYYIVHHLSKFTVNANVKYVITVYDATSSSPFYDTYHNLYVWNSEINPITSNVYFLDPIVNYVVRFPESGYKANPSVYRYTFTPTFSGTVYVGLVRTGIYSTYNDASIAVENIYNPSDEGYGIVTWNTVDDDIQKDELLLKGVL